MSPHRTARTSPPPAPLATALDLDQQAAALEEAAERTLANARSLRESAARLRGES